MLSGALDGLVTAVEAEPFDAQWVQVELQALWVAVDGADGAARSQALERLIPLLGDLPADRLSAVAIAAGTLVEHGARDPELMPALVRRMVDLGAMSPEALMVALVACASVDRAARLAAQRDSGLRAWLRQVTHPAAAFAALAVDLGDNQPWWVVGPGDSFVAEVAVTDVPRLLDLLLLAQDALAHAGFLALPALSPEARATLTEPRAPRDGGVATLGIVPVVRLDLAGSPAQVQPGRSGRRVLELTTLDEAVDVDVVRVLSHTSPQLVLGVVHEGAAAAALVARIRAAQDDPTGPSPR